MRYLFGFLCVCALGVVPLVGCSDTQAECEAGADCSDDNECTNDVCDSASRTCSNTPVDDGTDCTFNRVAGVCVSGVCGQNLCQGVVCEDDGNECTEDCNPATGMCDYDPVGDGTACSPGTCLDGACIYFFPGSGVLPNCDEPPITDLDGTPWFDSGTGTILTAGCQGALPDDVFQSCPLVWVFAQDGNDVTIVVDAEYRIDGRLCGDQLYLRGGWWLPVVDEDLGYCTYKDDSADEVGIQAEGNVLTFNGDAEGKMTGTLMVQGRCARQYEVTFRRQGSPP